MRDAHRLLHIVDQLVSNPTITKRLCEVLRVMQYVVIDSESSKTFKPHPEFKDHHYAVAIITQMDKEHGICENLQFIGYPNKPTFSVYLVWALAPLWDHYSGSMTFPVPDPESQYDPDLKYDHWDTQLWGDCPYGDRRRDLCKFIADFIEETITIKKGFKTVY